MEPFSHDGYFRLNVGSVLLVVSKIQWRLEEQNVNGMKLIMLSTNLEKELPGSLNRDRENPGNRQSSLQVGHNYQLWLSVNRM